MTRRSKYNAQPTVVDGVRFASKAEARRWNELRLLERGRQIAELERQPKFALNYGDELIGYYVADFEYLDFKHGEWVVEDVKGVQTELFKWKARHFRAQYGREIVIVK